MLRRRRLEVLGLHDRDELDVGRAELAAQEAIDVERTRGVGAVHAGQRVERHADAAAAVCAAGHHLVEGRRAALVDAVMVVDFARAVDAEADQEAVLLEEFGPFLVEQHAVGLQVVLDPLVRAWRTSSAARPPCGRSRARAASVRRPARRTPPPPPVTLVDVLPDEALEACRRSWRPPRGRPAASPCSGRSNTCSRDCRPSRPAWP